MPKEKALMEHEEIQLIQKKRQLLKVLENQYNGWNHTSEHAMKILEQNEDTYKQIEQLDRELSDESKQEFTKKYETVWNEILQLHKEMIQVIQEERENVKNQMNQISKKKKVVDEYIPKDESMFVDRDI